MKRLIEIEKKCIKWNVRNYQFLIFDESYNSEPEDENGWIKKLVDPSNFSYEERFLEMFKDRLNIYNNDICDEIENTEDRKNV